MKRHKNIIFNGSLLAVTSLLLRVTGLGFSAYISQKLGAEGTGLLSLVNTVYGFGITLAVSGIYLACMRLCSAALARKDSRALHTALQKSFLYSFFFGCLSFFLLFNLAKPLGIHFLGDERTVGSVRALAPALPFIALTTVTDSYFASVGRVYKSAASDVFEEVIKILCGFLLLRNALPFGTQACVLAVTKSNCIGEAAAFAFSMVLYFSDQKNNTDLLPSKDSLQESLLKISLPIAFSTYARSGLVTVEHALIPKGLQAHGKNKSEALSAYGIIRGMSLPIVLFPATVLNAFAGLLVPSFTEDHVTNNFESIDRKASQSMNLSATFSVVTATVLFHFGKELGTCIYKNSAAGQYVRYFALLIPFMYCDTTADSILKGLDRQVYTMAVNILDAALSVLMTRFLVPAYGLTGYIITICATELMNFTCSFGKLVRIVKITLRPLHSIVFPAVTGSLSCMFTKQLLGMISLSSGLLQCLGGICISLFLSLPLIMHFSYPAFLRRLSFFRKKNTAEPKIGFCCGKKAKLIR